MTLQRLFKTLTLTLTLTLALTACGNNGCEETRETYLLANLKATGRIELKSMNVWALTSAGDSLKITVSKPTDIEFNLNPDSTYVRYLLQSQYIDLGDTIQSNDTLDVRYTSYPYYLNMECGCSMFYLIEDVQVTNHLFKNFSLENNEISNDEKINIILKY